MQLISKPAASICKKPTLFCLSVIASYVPEPFPVN